jgi:hypothetical protein
MGDELASTYMKGGRNMFTQPLFVLGLGLSCNIVNALRVLFPQKVYDKIHPRERREYEAQKIIRIVKERTRPYGFTFHMSVMKNGSPTNREPERAKKSIVFRKHYWTNDESYLLDLKTLGIGVTFSDDDVGYSASHGFLSGNQSPSKSAKLFSETIINMEKIAIKYSGEQVEN